MSPGAAARWALLAALVAACADAGAEPPAGPAAPAAAPQSATGRGGPASGETAPLAAARVDERPGAALPQELAFRTGSGERVRLGDLLGGEPRILVLGYYGCPMLCGRVLEGAAASLAELEARAPALRPRLLAVSIDPQDDPAAARARQDGVLGELGWERARWPFLVGEPDVIAALTGSVGFGYGYDRASGQYAHPAVLIVLTPDGRVSGYVYGIRFDPAELEEALRRARAGETRASLHPVLLRCLQYVPALRRYGDAIVWFLRGGAALVVLVLGVWLARLLRADRERARSAEGS